MDITGPTSWQGSLVTSNYMSSVELQSLLFLQAPFVPRLSRAPGPELDYIERGVRFHQAWSLASNFEASSAVFAVYDMYDKNGASPMHRITAPTRKILSTRHREAAVRIKSHFIVPDGDLDEDHDAFETLLSTGASTSRRDNLRLRINWMEVYRRIFSIREESSETDAFKKHLETAIMDLIQQAKEGSHIPMITL